MSKRRSRGNATKTNNNNTYISAKTALENFYASVEAGTEEMTTAAILMKAMKATYVSPEVPTPHEHGTDCKTWEERRKEILDLRAENYPPGRYRKTWEVYDYAGGKVIHFNRVPDPTPVNERAEPPEVVTINDDDPDYFGPTDYEQFGGGKEQEPFGAPDFFLPHELTSESVEAIRNNFSMMQVQEERRDRMRVREIQIAIEQQMATGQPQEIFVEMDDTKPVLSPRKKRSSRFKRRLMLDN